MKKKNLYIFVFLLLISNVITFLIVDHFSRLSEYKEISATYKKEFSRYIVNLENNESKVTKMIMIGFIYSDILNLAESENVVHDYSYLCETWNQGLNTIIIDNFKTNNKTELNSLYLIGAQKLDKLCK